MRTITITLGHDGLTTDVQQARFLLADALDTAGTVLATFLDGIGTWDNETETCDAWLASIPDATVPALRRLLSSYAATWGQHAIGCIVHDPQFGPSYCEASP